MYVSTCCRLFYSPEKSYHKEAQICKVISTLWKAFREAIVPVFTSRVFSKGGSGLPVTSATAPSMQQHMPTRSPAILNRVSSCTIKKSAKLNSVVKEKIMVYVASTA